MSDAVLIAAIVATGPIFLGIANIYVGWFNSRKIKEVHLSMNSRLDQLLSATKATAHAEGMADQRAQSKREQEKKP